MRKILITNQTERAGEWEIRERLLSLANHIKTLWCLRIGHCCSALGLQASTWDTGSSSASSALRCDWHMQYCTCQRIPEYWASLPSHQNSPWGWCGFWCYIYPELLLWWVELRWLVFLLLNVFWFTFNEALFIVRGNCKRCKHFRGQGALWGLVKVKWNMTLWWW